MADIQSSHDNRSLNINKVGIRNVKIPIIIEGKNNHSTVGNISMYVNLPKNIKGTHMSRFLEILNQYRSCALNYDMIDSILSKIQSTLDAKKAFIEIEFPIFIEKTAPSSKKKSIMDYSCKFIASKNKNKFELTTKIAVPINTVCPCSKAISKEGAHNQRGIVSIHFKSKQHIFFEDIIKAIEEEASCELYPLLKREDEKYVTEKAFANPKFVEDVTRDVAIKLKNNKKITEFKVETENFESIHNHNAYSMIESR
ncbi:GTP cyclohydrolase I FolE2 [archaeon]|nr:GTP cyclohydrolase I FolE2 [archaeon]